MRLLDPNITLDKLLTDTPAQRKILESIGFKASRDGCLSLASFCRSNGLEPVTVSRMVAALAQSMETPGRANVELMTLTEICDHLMAAYHKPLWEEVSRLDRLTNAIADRYGFKAPELLRIREAFNRFRRGVMRHLRQEAGVIFPVIRKIGSGRAARPSSTGSVKSSLMKMEREHEGTEEAVAELRAVTEEADPSGEIDVESLARAFARVEKVIHEQIYIENRLLFARALAGEKAL